MNLQLQTREERFADELKAIVEWINSHKEDCDGIVVVLQKKSGGIFYTGNDSMQVGCMSFLLSSALYSIHRDISQ
jgi:hypothetical protein